MTVLEFIRQHPAQAVDVIFSEGCDHVTPRRSMALARDRPADMEILDWKARCCRNAVLILLNLLRWKCW